MNMDQLSDYFSRLASEMNDGFNNDIPDIVGTEAVNHFKDSFQNEGFTDKGFQRWDEVKRRQGKGKGADATRKILTGRTGNLGDSITYTKEPGRVVISANPLNTGAASNYAAVHNFGVLNAGRKRNTKIPKRQFLGPSETLNDKIKNKIERWLTTKLNA
jgi:phage virion morphogenesis protein